MGEILDVDGDIDAGREVELLEFVDGLGGGLQDVDEALVRAGLELLFGYVTDIRSLSKGRASASITPSHFAQVPNAQLAKIVETNAKGPART